ncbi:Uncharacterized protein APZ42_029707 [Daphnia magna]|uniref:Uncharacterized protein n=1 Tax=Daphnia magna TaxID=35525 RepID=A0A164PDW8_9CRUS|nr:Uncharacterized protein APZ42_029707 [Daphnia magna]
MRFQNGIGQSQNIKRLDYSMNVKRWRRFPMSQRTDELCPTFFLFFVDVDKHNLGLLFTKLSIYPPRLGV